MKNTPTVAGGTVLALAMIAAWACASIEGTKHDFSSKSWSRGDTCGACHAPHRDQRPASAPLWDPAADLNRTFGTSLAVSKQEGLGTLMCLRCHDGTVARDTIPALRRKRFANKQGPGLFGTGHGGSDHPVGIDYPQFDKGFRPMTSVLAKGTVLLPGGKVECTSCHDPHNQSGFNHFLVTGNARSALCLTCHRK